MKRIASALLFAFSLSLVAHADEASHKAKAEELVTTLHLERMVNGVMQNVMQQTSALTSQRYGGQITAAAAAQLSDFQKKLSAVLEPQIGWEAIRPEFVRLIVDSFPEDQIDTMLTFYKSAAGKALIERMPGIEGQVGQIVQKRVQGLQPQVRQMFDDFQKSLPAPAPAPATSAPPTLGPATGGGTSAPAPKSTPK